MKTIHYSIIIPHYNSSELLKRCLASIPEREDIEVIIVDDCSDPAKVDFEHLPGRNRPYTQVYRTPQGGSAGRARNIGLEHAKGQWLLFADADDYFEPDAWSVLDAHLETKADIVFFGTCSRISDTGELAAREGHTMKIVQQYSPQNKETEYLLKFYFYAPWAKMIRHSIVKEHAIRFEKIRYANDVMFSMRTALYAQSIEVDTTPVYCITEVYGSLTNVINVNSMLMRYEVFLRRNQLLRENGFGKYQLPTLFYLKESLTVYGFKTFCKVLQLAWKYKNNPFIGFGSFLRHPSRRLAKKKDQKYAAYEIHK